VFMGSSVVLVCVKFCVLGCLCGDVMLWCCRGSWLFVLFQLSEGWCFVAAFVVGAGFGDWRE